MPTARPPASRAQLAVVGFAFRFPVPGGGDFWRALWEGQHLVSTVHPSRWALEAFHHPRESEPGTSYTRAAGTLGDVSGFDAAFFGISPREAAEMDPQQRLLLELTWEALESGGIRPSSLRGSRCGVVVGFSGSDYGYCGAEDIAAINSFSMTGINGSIAANRISYAFDLRGPSMAVDTACSSSLVAFHQACQAIVSGDADTAIVGAVNLHLHPLAYVAFSKASMLSKQGACRAFDAAGDGYVRSEGGAIVVLKPLAKAVADGNRICALIAGSGLNCDGRTGGLTVPSAEAQASLLRETYARAGIDPAEIDYLEAHGTGTVVGDPIEARALGEALGKRRPAGSPLRIGSVKTNLGHLETAAGMAGIVKALLCLRHRALPRSLHFDTPNPRIAFADWNLEVVTDSVPLDPRKRIVIGVNSFGFGGANAHVILESFEEPANARPQGSGATDKGEVPLIVSARSAAALNASALRLSACIRENPDVALYDIAYSCAFHRDWHPHRAIVFGHDRGSAARTLEVFGRDGGAPSVASGRALPQARGPVFVYSGNGSQWPGMGGQLLAESAVFRQAIADVDRWVSQFSDISVLKVLAGPPADQRLEATEVAQPALFAVQVGLTRIFEAWGIRPSAVAGHSVGEMAAAWACGALSLEQAACLVCERSAWQGTTRGTGAMTAVALGPQELDALLRSLARPPAVAAVNSPSSVTVSGAREQLDLLEELLRTRGIAYHRLPLDYAFHSVFMDPIQSGVEAALRRIAPRPARIPFYSTVTGAQCDGEYLDGAYWWRNIRDSVRFGPAVESMLRAGDSVFVEVGPQPVLRGYLGECLRAASAEGRVIPTMSRTEHGAQHLRLRAFDTVVAGCGAGLGAFFPRQGSQVDLPAYPWQRERHWLAPSGEGHRLVERRMVHPLLGYRKDPDSFEWECHLDTIRTPEYADHKLGGETILPAAAYVEMAFAAAAELDSASVREIEDLEIRTPVALSDQRSQTIRFVLDPTDGGFTIKSRERASDHVWRVHVTGRVTALAGKGSARCGFPAFELPGSRAPIQAEAHYRLASGVGLEYGPAFRVVAEAWCDHADRGAGISARLATPECLRETAARCQLHPAFLDGAFQLLLHAFDGESARGIAYIPVRIGRATLLQPHAQARFAQLQVRRHGSRSLVAQCTLYGADREALAVLHEVCFRTMPLRPSALAGLSLLRARAVPGPLRSAMRRAALPATDSLVAACAARLHSSSRQETRWRYFNDVEPLLEALLAAFAAAARARLREHGSIEARQPALRRLERLERWTGESALPDPAALWTQMLRDFPDHAAEILWIGRLGMHLADIIEGRLSADQFLPPPAGSEGSAGSAPWMPEIADYAQAVSDMAELALASLPHGRRLRVLAINAEHTPAVASLLSRLDPDLCEFASAAEASPGDGLWDLVLVEDGLASVRDREQALGELRRQTADGGLLVLLERHPSRAVLLAMEFLAPEAQPYPRVQPLPPSVWRTELARQGYQQSLIVEDVPGVEASSYLLVARAVAGSEQKSAPDSVVRPRRWLVVADKSGLSARLGEELGAVLRGRRHAVELVQADCTSVAQWDALLAAARARRERFDSVVHLAGLAEQRQAPERMLRREAGRCEALAGMLTACAAAEEKPECWAVSARAAVSLLPAAVRESQRVAASADDAAYWGFSRTAINEYRELSLRLVDLAAPEGADSALDLAEVLLHPDAEDEMIVTPSGRYVIRMDKGRIANRAPQDVQSACVARLEAPAPGQLKNLRWTRRPAPAPNEGEVAIEVRAAGLNFRDVMCAMGQLPDEALEGGFAGASLGMEVAGVVRALGRGVHGLAPGDEVMAFAPSGFATQAVTRASAVLHKPPDWSFEAAATVQTAFFTAYHALHHLGRLERGERVLIHGGAGGVGLAAIQIAQMKGAEIFATAGSEAKRDLLRLLGVPQVFDSRGLGFADEILARTDGGGVDVVLNSLAGEAMQRSLQVLRPMGRFLELGKRDFYENTRVGLRPLRNNISYFAVDADQLMQERPDLTRSLMQELLRLFRAGALHPLPYRAFRTQEAVNAFRFMQQSRHIGKIVLSFDVPPVADAEGEDGTASRRRLELSADATYLVTGGLRGFGLRTAQWLAARGARHLVLVGRSAVLERESRGAIAALAAQGVQVKTARCDVVDAAALSALLKDLRGSMPSLRGVVHAAAVYHDGLIRNLDRGSIEAVLAPKVLGAANLHRLTRHDKLDFLVMYSSASAMFGNPGQATYVAANCYLEALAEARRANGRPALCVSWGPIDDAGYLARNPEVRERLANRFGGAAIPSAEALDALESMMLNNMSGVTLLKSDRASQARFPGVARSPKYGPLAAHSEGTALEARSAADLRLWVGQTGEAEALPTFITMLREEIADILRMDAAKIEPGAPLRDLGLDSLMGVELATAIEARFGVDIPVMALAGAGTIEQVARRIVKELKHSTQDGLKEPRADVTEQVRLLAARHGSEIDPRTLEEIAAEMKVTQR